MPSAAFTDAQRQRNDIRVRAAGLERRLELLNCSPSKPGASSTATRRLLMLPLTVFIWLSAGDVSTQRPRLWRVLDCLQHLARRVANLDALARRRRHADALRNTRGQGAVDQVEQRDHALPDHRALDASKLESCGVDQVPPLDVRKAVVEQPRLAEVVLEALVAAPNLLAIDRLWVMHVAAVVGWRKGRAAEPERIWKVRRAAVVDLGSVKTVALVIPHRRDRLVDRNLREVRPAQAEELRVQVRKRAALQKRIVGHVDARHQMSSVECDLLRLGEEVFRVAIERHLADAANRHQLFGPQLGSVEDVERKAELVLLFEDLDAEFVLGIVAFWIASHRSRRW